MNKVFKVIWNAASQSWVAVSELGRVKTKTKSVSLAVASALALATGVANAAAVIADGTTTIVAKEGTTVDSIAVSGNKEGVYIGENITAGVAGASNAGGASSVVIGMNATSTESNSVIIGKNVSGGVESGTMQGEGGLSNVGNVVIGNNSTAGTGGSVVIGINSTSTLNNGVAIGKDVTANSTNDIAIGTNATAYSEGTTSGTQSSIAIGTNATTTAHSSQSIGLNAEASAGLATATGSNSTASAQGATATGSASTASGFGSSSYGQGATSSGIRSAALGSRSTASGYYSTAVGDSAKATADHAQAFGTESQANGAYAASLGSKNVANGTNSVAAGSYNTVEGKNSAAVGTNNTVTADNAFVLGSNVTDPHANSVVLGANSTAVGYEKAESVETTSPDGTPGYTYDADAMFAGVVDPSKQGNYLSIGSKDDERQIKFLAAGEVSADSTDAINGSQLYAVMDRVENVGWFIGENGNAGEISENSARITTEKKVNFNNGSNTVAHVDVTGKSDENGQYYNADVTFDVVTQSLKNEAGKAAVSDEAAQAGGDALEAADPNALVTAQTVVDAINNTFWTLKHSATDGEDLGGDATEVKPGDEVEFVAGKNLSVQQEGGKITYATKDDLDVTTITLNGANGKDGADGTDGAAAPSATIGVAKGPAGVDGKDGADGEAGDSMTRIVYTDENGDTHEVATLEDGLKFVGDTGETINKKLNETLAIKGNAAADADVTDKNIRVDNVDGELIVKMAKDLQDITSISNGDTKITLGDNVVNMGDNKVTGVAPADLTPDSTDAVNGSQLYQTNQNVTNLQNAYANTTVNGDDNINVETVTKADGSKEFNLSLAPVVTIGDENPVTIDGNNGTIGGLTNKTFDPENIVSGQAATEDQLKQVHDDLDGKITNVAGDVSNLTTTVAKGLNFDANQGDVVNKQLGETLTIKGGLANDAAASEKNTRVDIVDGELIVKIAENPTFESVTAEKEIKVGDTTINNDGLTINNGPSITKDGIDAAGNKITNVAAGEDDTDAVNLGQLKELIKGTGTDFDLKVGESVDGGEIGDSKVTTEGGSNIKNGEALTLNPGKNIKLTATDKGFEIATKDDIEQTSVTVRGERGADGAQGPVGVTITAADGVGVIGVNGKDGASADITVAQGPAGLDGNDGANGTTKTRIQYQKADGTTENVATMNDGLRFVGDDGQVVSKKLNETLGIKGATTKGSNGQNVKNISVNKSSDGNLEVKLAKDIDLGADGSVRTGNTVMNNNGLTIANGPSVTSNGIDAGGKKITNVAAGTADTDAVNVGQLRGTERALNDRIHKLDKRVRGIGASSAAASSLPQVYIPGKSMVAAAAGGYSGASAVAVGYSRASDSGRAILKLQGTVNSQGHVSGGVGIGLQW